MLVIIAAVAPYHALDNVHLAVVPASMVGIYSLAVAGPPLRTYLTVASVIGIMAAVMSATPLQHAASDTLRSGGWVLAVALIGEASRIHRKYVAAIVERQNPRQPHHGQERWRSAGGSWGRALCCAKRISHQARRRRLRHTGEWVP
ncbi:hypothetical protein [Actinacidiphila soli]|uniref:hypothetical protein n=1 Tax=Actinacidiphila soli TaxID=2487275 RepID=UPI0019CFCC43|nr:hypothetical protein [Actinacidiphila soli]